MQEILKQAFPVRIDENGKEVSMPTGYGCGHDPSNPMPDEYMEEYHKWNNATEAIKLPTLIEFIEKQPDRGLLFADKTLKLITDYANFLKTKFSKGQFVACDPDGNMLVEPQRIDYKDGEGDYDEGHWKINNKEFQKAQDEVIFVKIDRNTINLIFDYHIPNDHTFNQALNDDVVIYMKIK